MTPHVKVTHLVLAASLIFLQGCGLSQRGTQGDVVADKGIPVHQFLTEEIIHTEVFTTFTSRSPAYTMEIPSSWMKMPEVVFEDDGVYRNARTFTWQGPLDSITKIGHAALTLTIVPIQPDNSLSNTLERYADTVKEYRSIGPTTVIQEGSASLGGERAREVTVSFHLARNILGPPPPVTKTKSSWIITKKGNFYYDLRYTVSEADYDTYVGVYTRAKSTLRF